MTVGRLANWHVLESLGLGGDGPPIPGRPFVRGESGNVVRWRAGWLEEVGLAFGWELDKHDKLAILCRAEAGLKILSPVVRTGLLGIADNVLALLDADASSY